MDQINVGVPKEINDYHEKFFGMTVRQLFFGGLGVALVILVYIFLGKYIPDMVSRFLSIIVGGPLFMLGFLSYNNMPAEKILRLVMRQEINLYQPIKYESDDEYNIRKWYFSHLTGWVSFKRGISKKMKIRCDIYFEEAKPKLIELMHKNKLPKKIKPRKLKKGEYKAKLAKIAKAKEEEKKKREENKIIKEQTDKKKQIIDENRPVSAKQPEPEKKKLTDSQKQELFDDIFGDMFK